MIQLSLFGEDDKEVGLSGITCRHCGETKGRSEFRLYRRVTGDRESRSTSCKSCQRDLIAVRDKIRKTAPPHKGYCECCGKKTDKLVLDHCYETEVFRGWLCGHCNMSIGLLGDNEEGLIKALQYLGVNTT